ncbi:MAG: cytochrome c biogenesis protein CcsA [Phycisphaerae bacterium]|nr:cytochrome c biogenesis protein CcsA [Phycisphaerae bacterium]MDW8262814.1 cytochrome c biogenesis protein CcsA [Phycisphaerales bacterium]
MFVGSTHPAAWLCILLSLLAWSAVPAAADGGFADQVDLAPLQTLSVQHRQTLKTMDSWARQTLNEITGRSRLKNSGDPELDGHPALFTVLDMCFRPEKYVDRNIIRIRNVPLRQDFALLDNISVQEKDRILREGTISLRFWNTPQVRDLMIRQQATAAFKAQAVGQLHVAVMALSQLVGGDQLFAPVNLIPPATMDPEDHVWRSIDDVRGNVPLLVEKIREAGQTPPVALPKYDNAKVEKIAMAALSLVGAWRASDAGQVNASIRTLAAELPTVNPARYPSAAKRNAEVIYNRLAKLTLPSAFLYFGAFVCFLMSARSGVASLRLWGLRLFVLAVVVHAVGIGIRWWLVSVTHGNWFDGIPIKNQFESVLMSAFFGCVIALVLALWRGGVVSSIIGAAASFVGWLSLVAIYSAPFVFGREIGGEIGQVAGVLMSYWLYLHVTMVVASYAMIGMSFLLGLLWLWHYYREFGTFSRLANKRVLAVDERAGFDVINVAGGAAAMSPRATLAALLFLRRAEPASSRSESSAPPAVSTDFMRTIDACNVVVLQLAFWLLGVGIILGAVWADQSWGRPWGWDPKETFALVTFLVYLIIVHTRITVENKGWWTAVLSVVGFFVMLFNWVGVNFFLVGLHSYA